MTSDVRSSVLFHIALAGAYLLLAIVHTYPLVGHLHTHLTGQGLGDNVALAWNFWWMRQAIASPEYEFFNCPLIFMPFGASVALHTHTALTAWLGATILAPLPFIAAQNVVVIGSLVLNGFSAYLLTRLVTGARLPSVIAGTLFLVAPSVTARLMGHYDLVLAWPLVFACASLVLFWRTPTWKTTVTLGLCAGVLPYAAYYYAVYFLLFALSFLASEVLQVRVEVTRRASLRVSRVALAAAALAFLVALLVVLSPVDELRVAGVAIRTRTPTNALVLGWLFAAVAVLTRWRFAFSTAWTYRTRPIETARMFLRPGLLALVLVLPIVTAAWQVLKAGDYVTQASSLKSSPRGVDVASVLLGPPFNGLMGERVRAVYGQFQIDAMECSAWLGMIVLALLAGSLRTSWRDPELRRWLCLGAVFAVWALGPFLIVLGVNTGLALPEALSRFVPVVNNARIPGRAMVIVELCSVILVAVALTGWARAGRRVLAALTLCAAVLERLAVPLPLVKMPDPGVYSDIPSHDRSSVLTLPFGIRDGFGERGFLEHDALYGQTVHGHALVGGFIARGSPRIWTWYESTEPYATLLRLSERMDVRELPPCDAVKEGLAKASVGYVVLYRSDAAAELSSFVRTNMPIERISDDGLRTLFAVTSCRS